MDISQKEIVEYGEPKVEVIEMKEMFKKGVTALTAFVMSAALTVPAFADNSKTAQATAVGDSASSYTITDSYSSTAALTADGVDEKDAEEIVAVNNGSVKTPSALLTAVGNDDLSAQVSGYSFVTDIFDLDKIGEPAKVNGMYRVSISVPALSANATDVKVLHYSTARATWELVTPVSVDTSSKIVTADFQDLSPVAIIAKVGSSSAAATNTSSSSVNTGVQSNTALYCGIIAVCAAVAIVAVKRRRNA